MSVNLEALDNDTPVSVSPKEDAPTNSCFIFYTTVKKLETGALVRILMREEVTFTDTAEVSEKIARSMYAIFSSQPIEWAVVTPSSTLPDLKYLHSQNEIFNLRQVIEGMNKEK